MAEPDNDRVSYYGIEDLSTWAENSPEKSRLERFESLPEAMAKFTEYREKETEEIKDFVKQRFEYQLKSSGLDDLSLYMDRFDALYEQGKMEHLMPTASQKHIVEDVPFTEWEIAPELEVHKQIQGEIR